MAGVVQDANVTNDLAPAVRRVADDSFYLDNSLLGPVVGELQKQPDPNNLADADSLLVLTKLHQPPPPKDLVQRNELISQLETGKVRPLTLAS